VNGADYGRFRVRAQGSPRWRLMLGTRRQLPFHAGETKFVYAK
jgi:hypothetical protein